MSNAYKNGSPNNSGKFINFFDDIDKYYILIEEDPSETERFGAEYLQKYLHHIFNFELVSHVQGNGPKKTLKIEIFSSNTMPFRENAGGNAGNNAGDKAIRKPIILGEHPFIKEIMGKNNLNFDDLGVEGYYFDFNDERIIIGGSKIRGVLFGIIEFLERFLGAGFYSPEFFVLPICNKKITKSIFNFPQIPKIRMVYTPSFNYRVVTYLNLLDPDFSFTQKCNLNPFAESDKGGAFKLSPGHMTHTFYQLVEPKKYFKDHPEYFALVDGKRRKNMAQLCLSNPDVLEIAKRKVLEWFEEDPEVISIGVVQNDINGYCECENCKKIEQEYGGAHSAPIIKFCNAIAEEVEKKYPDKFIHTIAYTYSLDPPKNLKVRDNIIVVPCDMYPECADEKPIGETEATKKFVEIIKEWRKIAKNIMVWHYSVDFTHFLLPFPNLQVLTQNTRIYKDLGMDGVLFQATTQLGVYGEFEELKNYILYKFLWNSDSNYNELINKFFNDFYGAYAEELKEYFFELDDLRKNNPNVHMHLYSGLEANYLSLEFVRKWQQRLEEILSELKSFINQVSNNSSKKDADKFDQVLLDIYSEIENNAGDILTVTAKIPEDLQDSILQNKKFIKSLQIIKFNRFLDEYFEDLLVPDNSDSGLSNALGKYFKIISEHIERVIISLDYAYLIFPVDYEVNLGTIFPKDLNIRQKVFSRFAELIKKFKIGVISESISVNEFLARQELIARKNNVLAIAELAPYVYSMLKTLLEDVLKDVSEATKNGDVDATQKQEKIIYPNQYINKSVKLGFHPLALFNWMNEKRFVEYNPYVDIWHRKINENLLFDYLYPKLKIISKENLPKVLLDLLDGMFNQSEEL